MHEHDIIYVIIKVIMDIKLVLTSKTRRGISQTNYVDHIVYANHKDCNFENKISIW